MIWPMSRIDNPGVFGIEPDSESDSSESEGEVDVAENVGLAMEPVAELVNQKKFHADDLVTLIRQSLFNWFEFHHQVETQVETKEVSLATEFFLSNVAKFGFSESELLKISESHAAFVATNNESSAYEQDQSARAINGEVVSDSDSDIDPQEYVGVTNPFSSAAKALVVKRRATIQRRARRLKAKAIAERRILALKMAKRTTRILASCPNIGDTIEK